MFAAGIATGTVRSSVSTSGTRTFAPPAAFRPASPSAAHSPESVTDRRSAATSTFRFFTAWVATWPSFASAIVQPLRASSFFENCFAPLSGTASGTVSATGCRSVRVPASATLRKTDTVAEVGGFTCTEVACLAAVVPVSPVSWIGKSPGLSKTTSRSNGPFSVLTSSFSPPRSQISRSAFFTSPLIRNVAGATACGLTFSTCQPVIDGGSCCGVAADRSTGTDREFSSSRKLRTVSLTE